MEPEIARRLPDLPRWMETRALLLSPGARAIGELSFEPLTFVVLDAEDEFAAVVGEPLREAIVMAARCANELLAFPENRAWVGRALPGWEGEEAILHVRPVDMRFVPGGHLRLLAPGEVGALSYLPDELRGELLEAEDEGTGIGAAIVGERPVAFCYAGTVSEGLWDIAVDTYEPYRRQGLAIEVVEFMVRYWSGAGKQPVWDAFLSNPASIHLAKKLGFLEVDRHWVFTREKE